MIFERPALGSYIAELCVGQGLSTLLSASLCFPKQHPPGDLSHALWPRPLLAGEEELAFDPVTWVPGYLRRQHPNPPLQTGLPGHLLLTPRWGEKFMLQGLSQNPV